MFADTCPNICSVFIGGVMELNKEEAELIAGYLAANWEGFQAYAEDAISVCAIHRLAEKLELREAGLQES